MRTLARLALLILPVALAACRDVQSVLSPQGPGAERVATLSWVLFVGALIIFVGVTALTALAIWGARGLRSAMSGEGIIFWGGLVFPLVTLVILLGYGFAVMRAGASAGGTGEAIRIKVAGELWWWRVTYQNADGSTFETANELRIPVGRPIEIELTSNNVIHSFWVPNLAGKLDMIPGRTNLLTLSATAPGISRGQCAEYCGGAHALMALYVVALVPSEFEAWSRTASGPARPPDTPQLEQGQRLFLDSGCGACHAVRGTAAAGIIGPDLTHVGLRLSIAAATLPATEPAIARWLVHNQEIKPENKMPPYGIFSPAELEAISAYLASLR